MNISSPLNYYSINRTKNQYIVTTHTDGTTATEIIDHKSALATAENPDFMVQRLCTVQKTIPLTADILSIQYVTAIHRENKAHPIEWETMEIPLATVDTVQVFTVTDGKPTEYCIKELFTR